MEYPVLTACTSTYRWPGEDLHRAHQGVGADHRRGADVLQHRRLRVGAARGWRRCGPARGWRVTTHLGRGVGGWSPILIFQMFTNFDALATALAIGAMLAWARRTVAGRRADRARYGGRAVPGLLLLADGDGRCPHRTMREVARRPIATVLTWLLVNLPVMMLFRGRSEFFRLNTAAATTWTRCTTS